MNRIIILIVAALLFCACNNTKSNNEQTANKQATTAHSHDHEGHDHSHDGHNHDAEGHSHEGCDHDHGAEGHNHEGHDHSHDGHNHSHEGDAHSHEGCDHDHGAEAHDHSGHNHSAEEHDHSHDGHNHYAEGHSHEGHNHSHGEEADDEIVFTKAQAAKINFKVEEIKPQTFYSILKTSGQVLSAQGNEVTVSATSSGIVSFANIKLAEGVDIASGQLLFSISGKSLSANNSDAQRIEAKSNLEKAKIDYERAAELAKDNIVSQKDFQQAKYTYEQAKINYETLWKNVGANGKSITAPIKGYLKNVLVQAGQYVEEGQALATITQNRRLMLRADVSQRYFAQVSRITSANFTTPYDNKNYSLDSLNGKLVSYGRSADDGTFYTPVTFEFDNKGTIIEGAFVEVFLKSTPIPNTLAIPLTSLTEDQGNYFVYIQLDEECYEQREVHLGVNDGEKVQIISGIKGGEKVVTQGAYFVKLASMSSNMPAHTHEH